MCGKPSRPKCETLQDTCRPRRVVCDFEKALIAAVETEFHIHISVVVISTFAKVFGEKFRT